MLDVITRRGTLSLTLMGTGVASTIACSIEGGVLNMGYVIARESVSSGFQVKLVAEALVPALASREGLFPGRWSLPWQGSHQRHKLPLALPPPAGEAEDALPPHLAAPALGPLHGCTFREEELSSGAAGGPGLADSLVRWPCPKVPTSRRRAGRAPSAPPASEECTGLGIKQPAGHQLPRPAWMESCSRAQDRDSGQRLTGGRGQGTLLGQGGEGEEKPGQEPGFWGRLARPWQNREPWRTVPWAVRHEAAGLRLGAPA